SGVNSTTWEDIRTVYNVVIRMVSTALLTAAEVHETEPFSWQPQGEANPINRNAAVQYLSRMVPPPAGQGTQIQGGEKRNAGTRLASSMDYICFFCHCTVAALLPQNGMMVPPDATCWTATCRWRASS
ncbi:hypothetical protein Vretifemale_13015, partial [Volvox reticuliferus]